MKQICVLGAGTWGTALAEALAGDGHQVVVWSAISSELTNLSATHAHPYLPGVSLNRDIRYEADIAKAVNGRELLLFAVPSIYLRSTVERAKPYIPAGQLIVSVVKGIEENTLMTMTEVIADVLGEDAPGVRIVALSGPTHAEEVAAGLPTAIVSACADLDAARAVQNIFMSLQFRVYVNADVKGVQLSGALKNIISLASGIAHGMGFGDNTRAAIITRGMAEMSRLGIAMGCVP